MPWGPRGLRSTDCGPNDWPRSPGPQAANRRHRGPGHGQHGKSCRAVRGRHGGARGRDAGIAKDSLVAHYRHAPSGRMDGGRRAHRRACGGRLPGRGGSQSVGRRHSTRVRRASAVRAYLGMGGRWWCGRSTWRLRGRVPRSRIGHFDGGPPDPHAPSGNGLCGIALAGMGALSRAPRWGCWRPVAERDPWADDPEVLLRELRPPSAHAIGEPA